MSSLENTPLSGRCVWVELLAGDHKCRAVKESCYSIDEKNMCQTEGAAVSEKGTENEKTLSCLWIPEEENNYRCVEGKDTGESINRSKTCEVEGAAVSENQVGNGKSLLCRWVVFDGISHSSGHLLSFHFRVSDTSHTCVYDSCSRYSYTVCLQHDTEGLFFFFF
jgi:hypothetical protein